MAFWGVEVKPGKPFTHIADSARDRLHISQATLGNGTATKKSVVQCNVGNKSPVFLCSLFPEKAESCQLNLEFQEANGVVFSVIGPRSVHLTGYFLASGGQHYNLNDESESFGEDIANTETERSTGNSDEDKYDDSFIDDSDPKLFPPSPLSDDKVQEFEETPNKRKPNVKDSHRRLKKKYQLSETDDDVGAQEHMNVNRTTALDNESEDMLPFSSLCKGSPGTRRGKLEAEEKNVEKNGNNNPATKNGKFEAEKKPHNKSCETINSNTKDEEPCFTIMERKIGAVDNVEPKRPNSADSVLPAVEAIPENDAKPKKKNKAQSKEGKDINTGGCCSILEEDKAQQNDAEADKMVQNLSLRNEENEKTSNYESNAADLPPDSVQPSTQTVPESDTKPKKRKRKDHAEKRFEANSNCHTNFSIEDSALQDEVKPNSMDRDLPVRNEQNEEQANNKIFDNDAQSAGEHQSEEKKKKKKKRKARDDGKIMNMETTLLPMDEKTGLVTDTEKSSDSKLSQLRTLSSGVVIEELEKGKSNGKVATSGKKISVLYTGKLKESGQVFDSSLDGTPFKFHLGGKDVLHGFNVGLEGMRVGEKRRIHIPPSMGYGTEGDGKNVPPNAALVFDVDLVKVHK